MGRRYRVIVRKLVTSAGPSQLWTFRVRPHPSGSRYRCPLTGPLLWLFCRRRFRFQSRLYFPTDIGATRPHSYVRTPRLRCVDKWHKCPIFPTIVVHSLSLEKLLRLIKKTEYYKNLGIQRIRGLLDLRTNTWILISGLRSSKYMCKWDHLQYTC